MSRRRKLLLGIGIPVVILVGVVLISPALHRVRDTTFRVTVPASTPEEDTIILHVELDLFPMTEVAPNVFEKTLDTTSYGFKEERRYGYSRGGFDPIGGEYGFGTLSNNVGHRMFTPGVDGLKEDTITEWRWFPIVREPDPVIPSQADTRPIEPRARFWAGPDIIDFWNPAFPHQYNSTVAHMKAQGYEWVQFDPPWDYSSIDPPVISTEGLGKAQWAGDALREEIRVFKQAGFKVYLGPQVCCTPITYDGRSEEWWRAWYDQYENFVQVHADLAREEGVDAFSLGGPGESMPGNPRAPAFAAQAWDGIFAAARSVGNVPLGLNLHPAPRDDSGQLHPPFPPEAVQYAPRADFIAFVMWESPVRKDRPTLEEIDVGFDEVFRRVDHTHNLTMKPFVFAQVAYTSEHSAASKAPDVNSAPTWDDPHANATRYDAEQQALVYESLMRHVADRSYIEGFFPFGYWYVNTPINIDCDIRDKPAERVFTHWLERFPQG